MYQTIYQSLSFSAQLSIEFILSVNESQIGSLVNRSFEMLIDSLISSIKEEKQKWSPAEAVWYLKSRTKTCQLNVMWG